ncbi:MAG: hypothetical protein A3E87_05200 [Gammaproteobacteria bacterium RIFCSPHIGHO2_12_FULL_35_23]|nr:MAG: hypothetical protein A3E87_05200 [Gammaproteobacteria bacterium RIFCSPHIGHO2_12_FULL_35_23]
MSYQNKINIAIQAVQQASTAVMDIYKTKTPRYILKSKSLSPFSEADITANQIICQTLKKHFNYPIFSEENKLNKSRFLTKYIWLVDPLDGTKEFLSKREEFTINVALIKDNRPIIGVIAYPAKNVIYHATLGKGAYFSQNFCDTKLHISKKQDLNNLKVAVSRSHAIPTLIQRLKTLNNCELIACGSALKYCAVAEGSIDATVRKTPLYEWDIAAADCILHEAGGIITDFSGKLLNYNNKSRLIKDGIIATNLTLHPLLLTLMNKG